MSICCLISYFFGWLLGWVVSPVVLISLVIAGFIALTISSKPEIFY